jgi:adenosylcobinamide-phosphate synthase
LAAGRPDQLLAWFSAALRQGAADPSPNAGVSQAAYAMAAKVRLGGVNRYADGVKVKPVLAAFAPPPDPAAIKRILGLTLKLELLWLVLAQLGLAGFGLMQAVR